MDNRNERAAEMVGHAAAEFLSREAGPQSLITVTHASLSSDFAYATVFITVLPEEKEMAALDLAHRHVGDFKEFLSTRVKLPKTPHVDFQIDRGQKNFERLQNINN
ncbi:MAG: ribosome-binding factor A [Minisyncoccia bacterium]